MPHINGTFWINENRNIAFFAIPKNSSTSIRNNIAPTKMKQLFNGDEELIKDDTLKITVLRDPVDRFVSGYLEVIRRSEGPTRSREFFKMKGGKEKFLQYLKEVEDGFFDIHHKPQKYYLSDNEGDIIDIDYFIIFERMKDDLQKIKDETGVLINPKVEWSQPPSAKKVVKEFITQDVRDRILELYKEDVELYKKHKDEE